MTRSSKAPNYKKYPYTICFIFNERGEVLLLNREKSPWKGCWNGIGGKLEAARDATAMDGIIREIQEEAGIPEPAEELELRSVGVMQWYMAKEQTPETAAITGTSIEGDDEDSVKGMYMFVAKASDETLQKYLSPMPRKFNEGILDWKRLEWVLDESNMGVVQNIRLSIPHFDKANEDSIFKCYFSRDHQVLRLDFYTNGDGQ